MNPVIDRDAILARLEALGSTVGRPLTVLRETPSTNDDARAGATEGAPHGAAWVADHQTGGRGRRGRRWHSPPGENVYLSLLLRPSLPAEALAPLSLVAGLAVADVIDAQLGADRAGIKWPNDVLVDDAKIAGILVETTLRGDDVAVVVGVGLNVDTVDFGPGPFRRPPTSLRREGAQVARELVAADLLARLGHRIAQYQADRVVPAEIASRDRLLGEEVRVDGEVGRGEGIGSDGALRLRTAEGRVEVRTGEVEGGAPDGSAGSPSSTTSPRGRC